MNEGSHFLAPFRHPSFIHLCPFPGSGSLGSRTLGMPLCRMYYLPTICLTFHFSSVGLGAIFECSRKWDFLRTLLFFFFKEDSGVKHVLLLIFILFFLCVGGIVPSRLEESVRSPGVKSSRQL